MTENKKLALLLSCAVLAAAAVVAAAIHFQRQPPSSAPEATLRVPFNCVFDDKVARRSATCFVGGAKFRCAIEDGAWKCDPVAPAAIPEPRRE